METISVNERLIRIERKFDELKHVVFCLKPRAEGWRQTVGAILDDKISRSAGSCAASGGNRRMWTKRHVPADFKLSGIGKPIGIAEYQLVCALSESVCKDQKC